MTGSLQFSETLLDTFKGLVTVFVFSIVFYFFESPNVSDFERIVTVDSLGPDAISDIEIESYEIQHKRNESHFRMTKKRDNDSDSGDDNRGEECYIRSHIRFQGFEYHISEPSSDHDDGELTETQIQKDFIFIFYLYGDFVLHGMSL